MKNIFKTFIAAILITGFASCEDEQDLQYLTPEASFTILTPQTGESVVLNPENQGNPALVLAWETMDYGTPTEVTYTVQVAANGSDFATPIDVTTTTNTYVSVDVATLNAATDNAGLAPFTESGLDVRIKASVGTDGAQEAYSNTIVYLVTPFSTDLPTLAVAGNHQGWAPDAADVPLLASSAYGETDYDGYVWLDGGFKLVEPNSQGEFAWPDQGGGTNYGGADGMLVAGGPDLTATAGYYRVKADTGALTYSLTATQWGVIGNATPGGWDNSTPMTYDPATRTWSVVVALTPQTAPDNGWKFRANNEWAINLGDTTENSTDGTLRYDGSNIGVTTAGNYLITLDLSNPRAYTYTVTLQ